MSDRRNEQRPSDNAAEQLPTRSLTPLSYLSAPVPDYASSLISHLGNNAEEANTAFLRESLDSMSSSAQHARSMIDQTRDPRLGLSRRQRNVSLNRSDSPIHRDRLQRYLSHLYRIHNPPASTLAAYSNRTPSPHRQSIYDWAPANAEQTGEAVHAQDAPWRFREQRIDGEEGPLSIDNTTYESERRAGDAEQHVSAESGLPSRTARMLRYFMDRERSGLSEEEERARGTGWYRPSAIIPENDHSTSLGNNDDNRSLRRAERTSTSRVGTLPPSTRPLRSEASPSRRVPTSVTLSENAVKYLDALQHCDSYDEALAAAMHHGLATKDLYISKHDEFILDLRELDRPSESPWLQPGTVFEGHQYATTTILSRARDMVRSMVTTTEQINPHYRPNVDSLDALDFDAPLGVQRVPNIDHRPSLLTEPSSVTTSAAAASGVSRSAHDHWPVRMTLHRVDRRTMTIQGTMEAYDVPRPSLSEDLRAPFVKCGQKHAPITTYVEGHIIDFFNYSFLTSPAAVRSRKSCSPGETVIFPTAPPANDAQNWHRLPPFNTGSLDDMAHLLLSKDRVLALNQEYIFMRWKERCFVHTKHDKCSEADRRSDHDRGHGLSISGFYYISLRRSDGRVEGVYYDPKSLPYQHLYLNAASSTWPSWSFR